MRGLRLVQARADALTAADGERGATAILVALLATALFGMAALVIDVGALMHERRQLQNGADAGALSVAQSCAVGSCGDATTAADTMADGNAEDGAADVESVTFPDANQVKVTTSTRTDQGSALLPFRFAQVIGGGDGMTVRAAATATWGAPLSATTLPLTLSMCEFNRATNEGTSYNTSLTGPVTTIRFHEGNRANRASDCPAQSGQDTDGDDRLPGGFGWLQSNTCKVTLDVDGWAREKPGVAPLAACSPGDLLDTTVLLPIFDDVNGLGGTNGAYHVAGFAAVHITGFRLGARGWNANAPCMAPITCVGGYFTRFVTTASALGGPDLGATAVNLIS